MQELSTDISKNHYQIAISQDGKFVVTFDTGKKKLFLLFYSWTITGFTGQGLTRNYVILATGDFNTQYSILY
jgi:hypothetical protein